MGKLPIYISLWYVNVTTRKIKNIYKKLIEGEYTGLIQMKARKEKKCKSDWTNRKQWENGSSKPNHISNYIKYK